MTNPFKTQRERAAYEVGKSAGVMEAQAKAQATADGEPEKPLTIADIRNLTTEQINDLWAEGKIQPVLERWHEHEQNDDE